MNQISLISMKKMNRVISIIIKKITSLRTISFVCTAIKKLFESSFRRMTNMFLPIAIDGNVIFTLLFIKIILRDNKNIIC